MLYGVREIRNVFQLHNANIIILFLLYIHFNPESSIMGITGEIRAAQYPLISGPEKCQHFRSTPMLRNHCHYHCPVLHCQFTDAY